MRLAIAAAEEARREGGVAIGAVLVDGANGRVLASGGSLVGITHDPTSHAEVNCIRAACAQLGTSDLYGHILYSTLEPCHMCLSAAAWAKIQTVVFGAYRKDVDATLFDVAHGAGDEREAARMNLREHAHMEARGGVLEKACADLLGSYHEYARHTM